MYYNNFDLLIIFRNNFTKRESTDGVSLTSVIDSPQISETEDVFKYEGSEESKARSNKHADLNHIDVINLGY